MSLGIVLLSDASEVDHLVLRQTHDQDGVLLLSVVINVPHRPDSVRIVFTRFQLDVVRCHFAVLLIGRALLDKAVAHTTLIAEFGAHAHLVRSELVDVVADKRHEADTLGDELVIEHRSVLTHLDEVNCHGGHFTDNDAAQ